MSEQENTFMTQLRGDFKDFKEDVRREYDRMRTFLLAIIGILLTAIVGIAFTHLQKDGETRTKVATLETIQTEILKQAASKVSIERLVSTFDNQTEVMDKFLPNDIQGAIKEFNKTSSELRKKIMADQKGIIIGGSDEMQK
ncbi:MAG: hypothetical protein WCT13_06165 [Patescibacteria group bacterium]